MVCQTNLGQKPRFSGILKLETEVSFLASFHCMVHLGGICAQFSKAAATKMIPDIIKIVQCADVYVTHHQCMKLMKEKTMSLVTCAR